MPNRADLMSLSKIDAGKDMMKTTTSKFTSPRGLSNNLATTDIDGAVPKLHGNKNIQATKQQWNLTNNDIEGSGPRHLHMSLNNKPDLQMKTNDIKWANPQCVKFTT
jgi:hypothetical protein